jgi:hypothetical protein
MNKSYSIMHEMKGEGKLEYFRKEMNFPKTKSPPPVGKRSDVL